MIPYSRQCIDKKDIKNVIQTLKSKFVTTGPKIQEFENKIKKITKSKYAIALNSATSALHVACLALGLKKNDLLWTSPISFVASANCALYCNAKVDFVDIDISTYNISTIELEKKLKIAKKKKKIPKILVIVNFAGQPCDLDKIKSLSNKYKFKIIEDSSHALGAKFNNQILGNGKFSDITVFSFHPVKIITTLEGGMALTNNQTIAKKIDMLRSHGITRNKKSLINKTTNKWYYEQQILGFNYRMNDVEAALGISQLTKLNKFHKKRTLVKKFYDRELKNLPVVLPKIDKFKISSLHLYVILLKDGYSIETRNNFIKFLKKNNIETNVHYIPIYLHPFYRNLGFKKKMFPNSENYFKRAVSLPIHPLLKIKDLKFIVKIVKKFFKNELR